MTGQSLGAALALPLLGVLGCATYVTRRRLRDVVPRDPLDVSPYCRGAALRTRQGGGPCLMCAFEVPVVMPTAHIRRQLASATADESLYALHALLSSWLMRVEVTATAFAARWRVSDAYNCWRSAGRAALAEQRRATPSRQCRHDTSGALDAPSQYGEWEAHRAPPRQCGGGREAVLKCGAEAIAVSLEPDVEGSRQAVLRLCYVVQPFAGFAQDSLAERLALWGAETYGKLLAAHAAHALERLEAHWRQ
ncbi:PIF1 helicase-like protein [Trypanosoma conorhini]|uniref:PIF1 helicase-like protein n=1 Tax=Trypanosoma conorhini TaxID=83891 RepID=A0A3R7LB80_9TRYP|nr:PIF1 helicase-like protein [Trypanosoma conorhini]RNF24897.1 PIF1 helicase-like protein [Trypanosoma conorhini]